MIKKIFSIPIGFCFVALLFSVFYGFLWVLGWAVETASRLVGIGCFYSCDQELLLKTRSYYDAGEVAVLVIAVTVFFLWLLYILGGLILGKD